MGNSGLGGSLKNFVMSVALLGLVVSLFFIPEIIGFYRAFSGTQSTGVLVASSSAKKVKEVASSRSSSTDKSASNDSGLNQIFALVSSGYLDHPTGDASSEGHASLNPRALDPKAGEKLSERGVTWEAISAPPVRQAFKNSQKDAATILKTLPENYKQSRFALLTFVNGIGWILKADKNATSPERALAYIEQLDLDVTLAMIREGVAREDLLLWTKTSLGPLLTGSRATRTKAKIDVPYRPNITLASLEMRRPPRSEFYKYAQKQKNVPTVIRVTGFIIGKDTDSLTLFRNGRPVNRITMKSKVDDEGKRVFRFSVNRGEGLYVIRATDKYGSSVETMYNFFPRADRFMRDQKNAIILPVQNVADPRNFSRREVDQRLDRLFRVASSEPGQGRASAAFERF